MKIGLSLILVIAVELLLATAGASARGFGGGTFAGNRLAVQSRPLFASPPGSVFVERKVFVAPAVRHRLVIEHPFPVHRRVVVVRPLVVVPSVVAPSQIIIVSPFTDCPQ